MNFCQYCGLKHRESPCWYFVTGKGHMPSYQLLMPCEAKELRKAGMAVQNKEK